MWNRLFLTLLGFERIKQRGDRFFLGGDFSKARQHYERARSALPGVDYRIPTLDALIRECAVRTRARPGAETTLSVEETVSLVRDARWDPVEAAGDPSPFVPNMRDLLELAIAHKPPERAVLYRGLGPDFELGYVALVQGDAPRAIESLRVAGSKRVGSFVVQLELGRALGMAGETRSARVELEKALCLAPSDLEALILLASVHLQLHQYSEAEGILLPISERGDSGAEPVFLLGQSLVGQDRQQEALTRFREAVERDPGFHDAYFEAGRLLRRQSAADGALCLLVQACSMAPEEVEYNRELAMLVLEHDLDVATGLAACDRLMVTDEENRWEYLGWIAELYLRRGWKREAIDPLRKAVDLVPSRRTREKLDLQKRLVEIETGLA